MTAKFDRIPASEVTPPEAYATRRAFLKGAVAVASMAATGLVYKRLNQAGAQRVSTKSLSVTTGPSTQEALASGFRVDEAPTPLEKIANYNNYYEFTTDKEAVSGAAKDFVARPWKVSVDGMVSKPTEFDLDDVLKISPREERIYRMRCVEAWSMVIPWAGYSLSKLLEKVEPLSSAKYVAFQTLLDPKRFPEQNGGTLEWPYVEGLRMDEAMHPLTLLASGLHGRELPAQNGAPLRLVTPWKYGFKGIKAIVKITLTDKEPPTTWNLTGPSEYGFYANVNPTVDHPRWSQASERHIGAHGTEQRPTLMFNGYAEQVGSLYAGMDLRKYY